MVRQDIKKQILDPSSYLYFCSILGGGGTGLASTLAATLTANHLPTTSATGLTSGLGGRAGGLTSTGLNSLGLPTTFAAGSTLPNLPISTSAASNLLLDDLVDTGKYP